MASLRNRSAGAFAAVLMLLAAHPAVAQGKGKGLAKKAAAPPAASAQASIAAGTSGGFRQFGSWLDDASIVEPGTTLLAISFSHYRSPGGSQNDFPVADGSIGLNHRTQFGVTVPHYSMDFSDGTQAGGLGDVYANMKIALSGAKSKSPVRFAVTPVVEIIQNPVPGTSRFSWGAPLSVETKAGDCRVFGTTGFFSRGTVFGSGAIEVPVQDRLHLTPSFSYTRSVRDDVAADAMGLARSRADLSVVAAYFLTPAIAAFGGTGRTLTNADGTGTSFLVTGGVSFTFTGR